jgi:hypothetical protein
MDKNFEIMKSMNYGYDNPESRDKLKIDESLIKIASKSVIDTRKLEMIALYASMSKETNIYSLALEQLKNVATMNNRIERSMTK